MAKTPFDIDIVMERVAAAVKPYPTAVMFQLAEDGFSTAFEQLVACIISIRTYDEETLVIARRLFAQARTPAEIAALSLDTLTGLIRPSTFYERKAGQIRAIAGRVEQEFGGVLPCDFDLLISFDGVGPKCANLSLGIACGESRISVDVHVHRVTNRWGYVAAPSPERTMLALEAKLPARYWVEINRVLVPFGKHVCTGQAPRCSTCPVLDTCRQVGVTSHR
jgi:endonuclease III